MDPVSTALAGFNFVPHGHCYLWRPDLLWLHVISDSLIGLAYYSIPLALWMFMRKRQDLAFHWVFALFATFIFACGTTHFFAVWNIWNADYYLDGAVKAATAGVSLLTAYLLWPLLPKALALPSPSQLQEKNAELQGEIQRREAVEAELRAYQDTLEQRVQERTRELETLNATLQREVDERRAAESRANHLFEASPEGLLLVDDNGLISRANQQAARVFDYDAGALVGRRVEDLIPPRVRQQHESYRQQYLEDPQARPMGQGRDLYGLRRDGHEVPLVIGLTPIRQENSHYTLASVIDISDRKELEEHLKAKNEALERSNAELEQFAFIASHDLREPLRKILSFANLLQSGRYGQFDDQGNEFLGYLTDAARRMEALLESLLRYSRVTSKAAPLHPVELNDVLEDVAADLQLKLEERQAVLDWEELPRVDADAAQMRQLFQNLIGNSLKYAREDINPEIRVTAHSIDKHYCAIEVLDNGIGFDSAYAEQIFEVFKRLHGRGTYEGTGVGLAICRKIVERHNGTISAESAPNEGARFRIVLPASQGGKS